MTTKSSRFISMLLMLTLLSACGKFGTQFPVRSFVEGSDSSQSGGIPQPGSSAPKAQPQPQKPVVVPAKPEGFSDEEIAESGSLKPTVYYFAVIDEDKAGCESKDKVPLHGAKGVELMSVCRRTLEICGEQGSCTIIKEGKPHSLNILSRVKGQDRFFEIDSDGCRFGYGVNDACLDPFYSLAADLSIYKPGDVIYVPAAVGLDLPNGKKHDGFFVVRDQGRGITGKGRFDFFSGFFSWRNPQNPFSKIGFTDTKTNVPYYKITGVRADRARETRSFPKLPEKPIEVVPIAESSGL
jgi:hypothetical protein